VPESARWALSGCALGRPWLWLAHRLLLTTGDCFFYGFGSLGLIWVAVFSIFGADAPGGRMRRPLPTYGAAEELAIKPASYMQILRCPAFWAIAASHTAYNWSWYLTLSWIPKYFVQVWGVSEAAVGAHAMRPYAAAAVFSLLWAQAMDSCLMNGWLSLWRVRWFSQIVSAIVPICVWIALILTRGSGGAVLATALLTVAVAGQTAGQAGFGPNMIDIAGPENAGRVAALSNTVATLPGIFGNILVGSLLGDLGGGWSAVFCTMAVTQAIGLSVFTTCGQVVPADF